MTQTMSDTTSATAQWDDQFEQILRTALPFLGAGEPLIADAQLRDLGLDSFAIIDLLVTLETDYDVRFRDEAMNRETFATPASLWAALSSLRDEG